MSHTSCRKACPLPPDVRPAQLQTINLYELANASPVESEKLLQAGIKDGFFYLDLTHPSYEKLLDAVDDVYRMSKSLFDLEMGGKMIFDVDKLSKLKINGYKPLGRNVGGGYGQRDGFESYAVPRNGMFALDNEPFAHPPPIADNIVTLRKFTFTCMQFARTIFTSLSKSLELSKSQSFQNFHRATHPSPDILRLLKYHARPAAPSAIEQLIPQAPHTDLGSLTFLFSSSPGLQVLASPDDPTSWTYVEPRAGHAIVNIGDALTILTNGLLKSSIHRVGPLPGCGMEERYSFAFLMRPEDSTVLRALDIPLNASNQNEKIDKEEEMTSAEWLAKKFEALRAKTNNKSAHRVLTRLEV